MNKQEIISGGAGNSQKHRPEQGAHCGWSEGQHKEQCFKIL